MDMTDCVFELERCRRRIAELEAENDDIAGFENALAVLAPGAHGEGGKSEVPKS
jgi:hypothetical protein